MHSAAPHGHPAPRNEVISLRTLRAGQDAVVIALGHQLPSMRQKYASRGIAPGARVRIVRDGNPIVVALEECRWAIDGKEAELIEVVPVAPERRSAWWHRIAHALRNALRSA